MVHGTHVIWFYISIYVNNGTAKVSISEKLGPVSKDQPPKYGTSLNNNIFSSVLPVYLQMHLPQPPVQVIYLIFFSVFRAAVRTNDVRTADHQP